ncbi:MAG: translation initiation factor IF-3 [Chloroflexi bacterium]|nr:translation initiation factor IF-3 [Chloroflexota bacterium]MBK6713057.1 translation initiation factor IF-3 [Chloroflexota bacterium]MBK7179490.1 translation initiation factor IF-3 [Chloroflexota bacterium]MBK7918971.1 translation initiation factor IF-3 [Chloroflexota bacterium]MBK8932405.1 translation initiation factor IF-3 [Chloroflexota bacterium]
MRRRKSKPKSSSSTSVEYRINNRIRVREVRLIDQNNQNHDVVPTRKALEMAQEAGLDLVEVAPNADPPVCRIMDYGKFAYEKTKREREARKHQKQIEIKTLKLTPRTAGFHRDILVKKAREWLGEGKKVKFQIRFRAREITYPEIGQEMLEGIATELGDVSEVEQAPKLEGWSMTLMLTPEGQKVKSQPAE